MISHDKGYDITIYRDISCHITPDHPETGKQTLNPVAVYCLFWLSVFALFLACPSSVLPFFVVLLFINGAGHIIGLTAPQANKNSNLVPSGLGRLPERMYVRLCFIHLFVLFSFKFFLLSLSFRPLGTLSSYLLTRHLVYFVNLT